MYSSKINIGNSSFFVKFIKYNEDDNLISKKFYFLRKYYYYNNIIYDKEIFIIDKELTKKVVDEIKNNEISDSIVFPYLDNKKSYYSNNYKNYNSSFNQKNFNIPSKTEYKYSDIYEIVDRDDNQIFIPCNLIKIYHPIEVNKFDGIIHLDSYYNDIHFHFYCNKYENHKTFVDNEINIDNDIYSEYIKVYIPDIEYLFFEQWDDDNLPNKNNTYYKENLSLIGFEENDYNNYKNFFYNKDKNLFPFNIFIKPFKIIKEEINGHEFYKKSFIDEFKSIENNYITSPVNLTIFPYKELNEENNLYILDDDKQSSTITFSKGYHFKINSKIGFDENGYCSIINKFVYENSDIYDINKAYLLYNNITKEKYIEVQNKLYRKYFKKAKYKNPIKDVNTKEEIGYPNNFDTYEEYAKEYDIEKDESGNIKYNLNNIKNISNSPEKEEIINEDYVNDLDTENDEELYNHDDIKLLGYKLEISNDLSFKNILYTLYNETFIDDNTEKVIDDFSFNITNIFDSWDNMPDILIARCIFIDKCLGKVIFSNRVIITKEWFKYLVNNDFYDADKIHFIKLNYNNMYLTDENSVIINETSEGEPDNQKIEINNLIEKDFSYMDISYGFNFIDKINCVIKKENNESEFKQSNSNQPKIIYKPIFYRVRDLDNIKLKTNLIQNIGINLSDYMTKVESFKISIENNTFVEKSRNNYYVIFEVNSNFINEETGRYVLTNEDDEYISDGIYTLY